MPCPVLLLPSTYHGKPPEQQTPALVQELPPGTRGALLATVGEQLTFSFQPQENQSNWRCRTPLRALVLSLVLPVQPTSRTRRAAVAHEKSLLHRNNRTSWFQTLPATLDFFFLNPQFENLRYNWISSNKIKEENTEIVSPPVRLFLICISAYQATELFILENACAISLIKIAQRKLEVPWTR